MGFVSIIFFFLPLMLIFLSVTSAEFSAKMGVNYGQLGNNLPSPSKSVQLLKNMKAGRVKIYDANPEILKALSGTNIQVSIMVPNNIIANMSSNQTMADRWIQSNVVPYYPKTLIRYLLVGNEILSTYSDKTIWPHLVPAMRRIKYSLKTHKVTRIKVGTTLAIDVVESTSFPPSNGTFRSDIAVSVIKPLLEFISKTKSFFFLDVYPYFQWASDPKNVELDYALFKGGKFYTDPVNGLLYTNLFEQMVDSVYAAMEKLGYKNIRMWIAETGWPNGGDVDQVGANIYNAATYNRNYVRRFTEKPLIGTPARPYVVLPTFLFSLYNENQKPGPGTERHFGVLYPNGSAVYEIDLTGKKLESEYAQLPPPENNKPYKGKIWCVAVRGANVTELASALSYACGQGSGTCDSLQQGKTCYKPNSLVAHASYAFSSYWSQFRKIGGTCYFSGLAVQTAKDPTVKRADNICVSGNAIARGRHILTWESAVQAMDLASFLALLFEVAGFFMTECTAKMSYRHD